MIKMTLTRKIVLFIFFTFLWTSVFAQREFFKYAADFFKNCNYDAALENCGFALEKLKEVRSPGMYALKDSVESFVNVIKQCDTLTKTANHAKLKEASDIWDQICKLQPADSCVIKKRTEVVEKIKRRETEYEKRIMVGVDSFKAGNYQIATLIFNSADTFEIKKASLEQEVVNFKESAIKNQGIRDNAYILYSQKQWKDARTILDSLLRQFPLDRVANQLDTLCTQKIDSVYESRLIPETTMVGYCFQPDCPVGITVVYLKNWGLILSTNAIRFAIDEPISANHDYQYSVRLGFAIRPLKNNKNLYVSLGPGYGRFADFWYEKGEKAHQKDYPNGLLAEAMVIYRNTFHWRTFLAVNFFGAIGWTIPTFQSGSFSFIPTASVGCNLKFNRPK